MVIGNGKTIIYSSDKEGNMGPKSKKSYKSKIIIKGFKFSNYLGTDGKTYTCMINTSGTNYDWDDLPVYAKDNSIKENTKALRYLINKEVSFPRKKKWE